MTRDSVRLLLAPALVFIVASLDRGYQTDYWQHLARGRLIARERAVVSTDCFTYTVPGAPMVDNNWLTQLLYHALHSAGGLSLVQFVNALTLAGAAALLVSLCRRTSGSTGAAASAGVLAFFGLWPTVLVRPQTFSVLLFVALYALLSASARRPRLLLLPPLMMALWANVHGGFAVGLLLLFAFALAAAVEGMARFLPLPSRERAGVRRKRGTSGNPILRTPVILSAAKDLGPEQCAALHPGILRSPGLPQDDDGRGATKRARSSPASPPRRDPLAGSRRFRSLLAGSRRFRSLLARLLLPRGGQGPEAKSQLFPLVLCLAFSAPATLMNPYGWNVYRYAGKLSAAGMARGIEEWLPPSPATPIGAAFFASLAALAVLVVGFRRRPTAREACVLACFAVPACLSVRMAVWWHLAAAPVLARLAAAALLPRQEGTAGAEAEAEAGAANATRRHSPWAGAAMALLVGACVVSLPWLDRFNPAFRTLRPAARVEADIQTAVDRMAAPDERRVYTRMEWANYVAWSTAGRRPVFLEGHVELYPDDTWAQYLTVTAGRDGWDGVLDRHAVDYLLLDEDYHVNLLRRVRQSSRWTQRLRSGPAVLFGRAPNGAADAAKDGPGVVPTAGAGDVSGAVPGGDF